MNSGGIVTMMCINRNIVECKDLNCESPYVAASGINRNIVECKDVG